MKDIQKIKEFFSKSIDEDFGQALFNRLKPKDSDLESIVNTLKQDLKIANAPDQASFKEALERYIRFNGDRDPIGQAAVRALNYRTTGDRYGNGFTRIFDMLINKKNLPEAKSNTIKKSELTNMIQEVINEYSVYQGDVSKMKPKPTPKEGEVYLKDLKPGDKFKPLKSDLEYIVVTPENGIRGVGVKHVDGTGNMNFRGDVIVKVISEQSTNKEGWLVKSNEDDTKYIVVHTSKVDNKSNRISQIYKDKKLADKRANDLNKKPGFNKYEEIVSKSEMETSMNEASMLDKYEVDFFHTKANVYANIEIPSENPTFEDDIQIKGTGKTEEEAFEDLKQNYEKYKKTGINEAKEEDRYKRPIVTNKQGEKFILQGFSTSGYYLIPYDGSKYWEHFSVPKNEWIPEKSINWDDYNFTKQQFEKLKASHGKSEKEISKKFQDMNEAKKEDAVDTITMDIPLFIRILEYSREDAAEDMDLHDITEKAISLGKERGILQMDDYDEIVGAAEDINELSDYFKRRKAQDDYAVNKKDKPAKPYNPNSSGKTDYMKRREKELAERIAEALDKINEELCPAGKAYIKRRQAAGEKSSAYLSGRAVKVCKGQMSGKKKKK
jgi:hypothetical protein